MTYHVRNATKEDMDRIQEVYAYARSFMAQTGNPNQWGNFHPPVATLYDDIEKGLLHVIEDTEGIHGVFYFYIGEDPTYNRIDGGSWRSDTAYGTIHRIAGDGSGGILKTALEFGKSQISHIRIDTHEDNIVMQNAVAKLGFSKRGIIYLPDGNPRIAYDLLVE